MNMTWRQYLIYVFIVRPIFFVTLQVIDPVQRAMDRFRRWLVSLTY